MPNAPEWFEYDWPQNGRKSHVRVDMSLKDVSRDGRDFVLLLTCASRAVDHEKTEALTPREKRHAEALLKKCLSELKPVFAGSVEMNDSITYYFYVEEAGAQKRVTDMCSKEKVVFCATDCVEEPSWPTYFTYLYPDRAKLWTEENRKRIEFMEKHGDSPEALRRVSFYAYFPSEQLAMDFTEEARRLGFAKGEPVFAPEQELPYGTLSYKITSIKKLEIDMLTTKLVRAADKFSGELTYWESQLTRRNSPFLR